MYLHVNTQTQTRRHSHRYADKDKDRGSEKNIKRPRHRHVHTYTCALALVGGKAEWKTSQQPTPSGPRRCCICWRMYVRQSTRTRARVRKETCESERQCLTASEVQCELRRKRRRKGNEKEQERGEKIGKGVLWLLRLLLPFSVRVCERECVREEGQGEVERVCKHMHVCGYVYLILLRAQCAEYIYIHMYTYLHPYLYSYPTCISIFLYPYTNSFAHPTLHSQHVQAYKCRCICTQFIYVYIYVYLCIYTSIYIHTCIYAHMYININICA